MPNYEVVSRQFRRNGKTSVKGDTVTLPAADGEILINAGRLKKATATQSSSGAASASTAAKAPASK
jgi:hypothetical protein